MDLAVCFDSEEEAEAAFSMFDRDLNGDISVTEMELACGEIGRERKAVIKSLKVLDSVVGKLDNCFSFIVAIIVIIVFLTLISKSTAGKPDVLMLVVRKLTIDRCSHFRFELSPGPLLAVFRNCSGVSCVPHFCFRQASF